MTPWLANTYLLCLPTNPIMAPPPSSFSEPRKEGFSLEKNLKSADLEWGCRAKVTDFPLGFRSKQKKT
jgi:hypothetical protein